MQITGMTPELFKSLKIIIACSVTLSFRTRFNDLKETQVKGKGLETQKNIRMSLAKTYRSVGILIIITSS